ncbi:helix-turn-helix domain-containing protein [Sulfuricurvum sp.]|uniref:helix-turn-helix domain-containing protein n=1 Tax=Sulfuricurvum sp. TaxID=2025608 RepID=UPI002619ECDF|nr:helix-turn-helix domain-containing protein [Sulfuricurvum sp.]MDD2267225.1 helix-turn-helix domain-containing protein [Sulfuricurvum sp.]MDD2782849.1 helix-turn-helix domain-containing protein [Sulfuricurvum sp.]
MMFEAQLLEAMKNIQKQLDSALNEISELKGLFHSDYVTVAEVAVMKGVSEEAIRKKIRNGDIDPKFDIRKTGRTTYIKRTAIEKITVRKSA